MSSKADYYPLIRSHPQNCREKCLLVASSYRRSPWMFDQPALREIYKHATGALFWKRHAFSPLEQTIYVGRLTHAQVFPSDSLWNFSYQEVLLTTNATSMNIRRETIEWNMFVSVSYTSKRMLTQMSSNMETRDPFLPPTPGPIFKVTCSILTDKNEPDISETKMCCFCSLLADISRGLSPILNWNFK